MKIGLTYDLREFYESIGLSDEQIAEFDSPSTIKHLVETLEKLGHEVDPIGNAQNLIKRLADGDRWDLVFNIAEGLNGFGREAQVPAILDVYNIPYTFSDPLVSALTLHKGMTKQVVKDLGIPTANFYVVEKESDLKELEKLTKNNQLTFPLLAKPIAEGTSKGVNPDSKIKTMSEIQKVIPKMLRQYKQPVLVEDFLPGREFTVGILGTGDDSKVVGVVEIILLGGKAEPEVYSYINKEECEERVWYKPVSHKDDELVKIACDFALKVHKGLGCRDASRIDFRADKDGTLCFIEANPLPGLHPTHSDLPIIATNNNIDYVELLNTIVESAAKRADMQIKQKVYKRGVIE